MRSHAYLLSALVILFNSSNVFAQHSETIEVWLSKSSFDGSNFQYEYTVYDAARLIEEKANVSCQYSDYKGQNILSAVEVKLLAEAVFDKPGQEMTRAGRIDIRSKIDECRVNLSSAARALRAPVRVILPPLSTPSVR